MTRGHRRRSGANIGTWLHPHEITILVDHHQALARDLRRAGQDREANQLEERVSVLKLAAVLAGQRLPE